MSDSIDPLLTACVVKFHSCQLCGLHEGVLLVLFSDSKEIPCFRTTSDVKDKQIKQVNQQTDSYNSYCALSQNIEK